MVFAAIEALRAAELRTLPDDASLAEYDEVDEAYDEAYWSLLGTQPTTLAGFVAMFEYLAEKDDAFGCSNMRQAMDFWAAPDDRHPDEAGWLLMLAGAMKRLAAKGETQS